MTKSEKNMETISGDGLCLSKDSNKTLLEIKGDGCKITVAKNCGTIRIIGDGCRLKVILNLGSIEYNGDGGRVALGPDSNQDKVTFIGHGSHVKIISEKPVKSANLRKESGEDNLLKFQEKRDCSYESENQLNERRERRKLNDSKSTRGSTVIVTKIVNVNGECKTNVRTFYQKVAPTRS